MKPSSFETRAHQDEGPTGGSS